VAHWATLAAVFLPVLFGIAIVTNNGTLGTIVVSLLALCVGLSLLIHNIDALRAGLVRGTLPWIGILDGVAFLLVAIGIYAGIGILALWIGLVFYIAWAIWMGVRLRRTKAVPTAGLAPS
jgi:TctA family transporter